MDEILNKSANGIFWITYLPWIFEESLSTQIFYFENILQNQIVMIILKKIEISFTKINLKK